MQNLAQNQALEGFKWEVVQKPIYSNNQPLTGHKALFRSDTNTLLNVAKTSYTPTTNARFIEVVERMSEVTGLSLIHISEPTSPLF
jgi:hypothetical protein